MLLVFIEVVEVDQDVIKIYNYEDVHHVREDIVHEALESSHSVRKSEKHNQPFEGPIVGPECGFPLTFVCDMDKMVGMLEVNLDVDSDIPRSIQKVSK